MISFHPLLFPTVHQLLTEPGFDVQEYRFAPDASPAAPESAIPVASVYVVEAHEHVTHTEAAIEKISSRFPSAPFLVIGEKFDEKNSFPLLRLKIKALVTYADAPAQLARAVEAVASGGFWLPRLLLSRFVDVTLSPSRPRDALPGAVADLTHRERQVLEELLDGLSNKEIARKLGITERGVKFHVSNLLLKHRVRRRADLALLFMTMR